MVGDAVWPKFVEDCPYRFLMENVQLLSACWCNRLHLNAIKWYRGDTALVYSQLGKLAVHHSDCQTGLRLDYAPFAIDVFIWSAFFMDCCVDAESLCKLKSWISSFSELFCIQGFPCYPVIHDAEEKTRQLQSCLAPVLTGKQCDIGQCSPSYDRCFHHKPWQECHNA